MTRLGKLINRPLVVSLCILVMILMHNGAARAQAFSTKAYTPPAQAENQGAVQQSVAEPGAQKLSAEAFANFSAQAEQLRAEKEALTPLQRKVNSSIIRHLHTNILHDRERTLPKLESSISLSSSNEILTDIKANVSDSLVGLISASGGTIINKFPQYNAIRALIPIESVEWIAAHPDVTFIDMAHRAKTNKLTTSAGVVAHSANVVQGQGYTGAGVKVGVMSDSADYLATVQSSGDLPPNVTVLPGQCNCLHGATGEGTAMMEIVYDMAPGALLYFATAFDGPASFANNIVSLAAAGCKVIIDDVSYYNESPFQDDIISQAVRTVTQQGVLYFSSAANGGNKDAVSAGNYEADYLAGGPINYGQLSIGNVHEFASGIWFNKILANPSYITLQWSDPLGGSANDYDLYVIDGSGNVISVSDNVQDGTQDPYESIQPSGSYVGYYVVINEYSGISRFLRLTAITDGGNTGPSLNYYTNADTKGHPTVESAFGVAAVSANGRTTPFTGSETLEYYTSDGPRRVFYNSDGSAITPGNLSSSGGKLRIKPDITAADCVATSTPGFNPFCGTSAAAPHAGGIAALLLSANPGASADLIHRAMATSGLPAALWNEDAGYGIVMANTSLTPILNLTPPETKLLWLKTDGTSSLWTLDGIYNTLLTSAGFGPYTGWKAVNYRYDPITSNGLLLWSEAGGASIWTLNSSDGYLTSAFWGPYTSDWRPISFDFTSPTGHLVWWSSTQQLLSLWTLNKNSTSISNNTVIHINSGWTPINYTYDSTSQIGRLLWLGPGGLTEVMECDGFGNVLSQPLYGPLSGWTPVNYSYDPVSKTGRLVWSGTGGQASIWTLNSSDNYITSKVYGPFSGWAPVGYSFAPDGITGRLAWSGTGGQASLWTLNSANRFLDSVAFGPYSNWAPINVNCN